MNTHQILSEAASRAAINEIVATASRKTKFPEVYVYCTNCVRPCAPREIDGGKCIHCKD